ncbi:MAG: pantoate--beta-alanine ligase [Candidatus Riflemargulisbacteria bacterium]
MEIIKSTLDYNNFYKNKLKDKTIGFVPTMGFLHEGHISLIKESTNNNQITVVSIFVNPTQFGKDEDYNSYPRNEANDIQLLIQNNVDVLFIPPVNDIYLEGHTSLIELNLNNDFISKLCGKYRPGHFNGVGLIVMKLFSIIKADNSYFGLKDYQQYLLIKDLAVNFYPSTTVVGLDTVREKNGLAMSSRNSYLTSGQRLVASSIFNNLVLISNKIIKEKNINQEELLKEFELSLMTSSDEFKLQYFEIYDDKLNTITTYQSKKTFIGVSIYLNNVRLIDNIFF